MRLVVLLVLLCGCATTPPGSIAAGVGFAAANVASVSIIGRTLPDAVISVVTDKDCSAVRLEQGKTYCRHPDPPPTAPPFCTRGLADVECWPSAEALAGPPRHAVADGPSSLTPEQEAYRTRAWPYLGF
jgi:hypothetical protein